MYFLAAVASLTVLHHIVLLVWQWTRPRQDAYNHTTNVICPFTRLFNLVVLAFFALAYLGGTIVAGMAVADTSTDAGYSKSIATRVAVGTECVILWSLFAACLRARVVEKRAKATGPYDEFGSEQSSTSVLTLNRY
jgi:hypothetical protein